MTPPPIVASPRTRGWTRVAPGDDRSPDGFPAHAGMDREGTPRNRASGGLPRARGDGPGLGADFKDLDVASPRTRGWTPAMRASHPAFFGFPAHAGMDPSHISSSTCRRRLPRARGDGPSDALERNAEVSASPRTRGWTFQLLRYQDGPGGFPAHAGMDPLPMVSIASGRRLPRARGDGPSACCVAGTLLMASPRTRGWTIYGRGPTGKGKGFPAHAGMDPDFSECGFGAGWLPRARGDGPVVDRLTYQKLLASPRTGGWTRSRPALRTARTGFPAHAGMDPSGARIPAASRGLPRARGDGPSSRRASGISSWASPRTRGWTRIRSRHHHRRLGFPAHAGMDPAAIFGITLFKRLPRARGDGPKEYTYWKTVKTASPRTRGWTLAANDVVMPAPGFPAHAGMDPFKNGAFSFSSWLPRARGDGPWSTGQYSAALAASPRTRGWTLESSSCRERLPGFPAHAGMDPMRKRTGSPRSWLPRARGDGPSYPVIRDCWGAASPRTRGWTRYRPHRGGAGAGFPAHAGMDPSTPRPNSLRPRLPRARGDGPLYDWFTGWSVQASPRTRGWTPQKVSAETYALGFPAHAGMDPSRKTPPKEPSYHDSFR